MVYEDWEEDLRGRDVPLSKPFRLEMTLTNDVEMSRQDTGFCDVACTDLNIDN
jgi:hypothetical protein